MFYIKGELKPKGSFEDYLLQEIIFREKSLDLLKQTININLAERLLIVLEELLNTTNIKDRVASHKEALQMMLNLYEAELFQESYLPIYQKRLAETLRKKRMDIELSKQKEAEALKKVENMED